MTIPENFRNAVSPDWIPGAEHMNGLNCWAVRTPNWLEMQDGERAEILLGLSDITLLDAYERIFPDQDNMRQLTGRLMWAAFRGHPGYTRDAMNTTRGWNSGITMVEGSPVVTAAMYMPDGQPTLNVTFPYGEKNQSVLPTYTEGDLEYVHQFGGGSHLRDTLDELGQMVGPAPVHRTEEALTAAFFGLQAHSDCTVRPDFAPSLAAYPVGQSGREHWLVVRGPADYHVPNTDLVVPGVLSEVTIPMGPRDDHFMGMSYFVPVAL